MKYRALINVDFTGTATPAQNNAYEKLKNALVQCGWRWIETSAFVLDTDDIVCAWQGIGLVARQASAIREVSALTFHLHGDTSFVGRTPKSAANHPNALTDILARPFPKATRCP